MDDDFDNDLDDLFDDDDYIRSDFDKWVDDYTGSLLISRDPLKLYPEIDLYPFYYNIFKPAKTDIRRIAPELLYSLFPDTRNILFPRVLKEMEWHFNRVGVMLLLGFFKLKMHIQYKHNLREAYENFDELEKKYIKYQESRPYWFDLQEKYPDVPQEVWDTVAEHTYEDSFDGYEMYDYVHEQKITLPLQQILISYCPQIMDFTREQWVIFYDILHLEYCEFLLNFDTFACSAEYNFTEEETLLPYKEFMEVLSRKMQEERDAGT